MVGRPTDYTQDIANDICSKLAEGQSLRAICRSEAMPHESTVRHWAVEDREGFFTQYTRSRDIGLDCMADEVQEIADGDGDVARDRLRFDSRRWYLSKMAPKRYGDKLTQELTGLDGGPLETITRIELVAVGPDGDPTD